MKVNKENMKKWIDALRSGKYEQGKRFLHSPSSKEGEMKHCCLGVLEIVSGASKMNIEWQLEYKVTLPSVSAVSWVLPENLVKNIRVHGEDGVYTLVSHLNDKGASFSQIACYLEAEFLPEESNEKRSSQEMG